MKQHPKSTLNLGKLHLNSRSQNRTNEGSLLKLFQSPYFDIHMLMKYLETREEPGVIIYLINKLFDTSTEYLDLYLPQICYLALTKESEETRQMLEKFILEISMQNPNIGFRALHHF